MNLVLFASNRKFDFYVRKSKDLEHVKCKVDAPNDFAMHSLWRTEDMCVILSESTNARQPVQGARELGPINRPEFGISKRQLAIGTLRRFINPDVKGAVHGLDTELLLLKFHGREHRVRVVLFMPAGKPQIALCNMRGEDYAVSTLN